MQGGCSTGRHLDPHVVEAVVHDVGEGRHGGRLPETRRDRRHPQRRVARLDHAAEDKHGKRGDTHHLCHVRSLDHSRCQAIVAARGDAVNERCTTSRPVPIMAAGMAIAYPGEQHGEPRGNANGSFSEVQRRPVVSGERR